MQFLSVFFDVCIYYLFLFLYNLYIVIYIYLSFIQLSNYKSYPSWIRFCRWDIWRSICPSTPRWGQPLFQKCYPDGMLLISSFFLCGNHPKNMASSLTVFSEQNGLETAVHELLCRISSLGFGLICTFFCKISTEIYLWVAWWIYNMFAIMFKQTWHEIKNMVQGAVGDSLPQNRRGTRIDLQ